MNKKSLILLPAMMMILASCGNDTTTDSSSSSSSTPSSSQSSSSSSTPVTPSELTSPLTLDFVNDFDNLKADMPYVSNATDVLDGNMGGLNFKVAGCYVGSYSGVGYLSLKSKTVTEDEKKWDGGLAFIASADSLGKITKIEITIGSGASDNGMYAVTFSETPITAGVDTDAVNIKKSATKEFTPADDKSYGYFAITSTSTKYNGQIGKLTITFEK